MTQEDEIVKRPSTIKKENQFFRFIENFSKDKYTFFTHAFLSRRLRMNRRTINRRLSGLTARGMIRVYQITGTDKMLIFPKSNFHNIENILKKTKHGNRYVLTYTPDEKTSLVNTFPKASYVSKEIFKKIVKVKLTQRLLSNTRLVYQLGNLVVEERSKSAPMVGGTRIRKRYHDRYHLPKSNITRG